MVQCVSGSLCCSLFSVLFRVCVVQCVCVWFSVCVVQSVYGLDCLWFSVSVLHCL